MRSIRFIMQRKNVGWRRDWFVFEHPAFIQLFLFNCLVCSVRLRAKAPQRPLGGGYRQIPSRCRGEFGTREGLPSQSVPFL